MAENVTELFDDKPQAPVEPPKPAEPVAPAPIAAAPEPAKPEAPKPEPGYVPIAGLLDEREKRQAAERRYAELEERHKQAPSVPADPEQLAAYLNDQNQRALTSGRFDVSETLATQTHGEAMVKEAMEWGMQRATESPAFAAEYMRQKHPIDWAVRQHKKEKLVSELGDDEATQKAYIERRARELGLIPSASPTPAQPTPAAQQPVAPIKPAAPTPSLASAPSAGGPMTPVAQTSGIAKRLFGE